MSFEITCKKCGTKFNAPNAKYFICASCKASTAKESAKRYARRRREVFLKERESNFNGLNIVQLKKLAVKKYSLTLEDVEDLDSFALRNLMMREEEKRQRKERLKMIDVKYGAVSSSVVITGEIVRENRGRVVNAENKSDDMNILLKDCLHIDKN